MALKVATGDEVTSMKSLVEFRPDPVIARFPVGSAVETAVGINGLATASFDETRQYRYRLSRIWDGSLPRVVWCLLNPSTASATASDPTLTRTIGFSRLWGYGAVEIVNLFALRTPDPRELSIASMDPVGAHNDAAILDAALSTKDVIAAWGNGGSLTNINTGQLRGEEVRSLLSRHRVVLRYLRLTGSSQPGHPLYLPGDLRPTIWT